MTFAQGDAVSTAFSRYTADMTHQVPEPYCSVSERLSNILDNVGYSREDRESKVKVATETEVFCNMAMALDGRARFYLFGSKGDGSTGPDLQSDIDRLLESYYIKVVTDESQCQPEMTEILMVKDIHTHTGYIRLQLIGISPDYTPAPIYLDGFFNDLITIDSLNRAVVINTAHHFLGPVSGPTLHQHHEIMEFCSDVVCAFRCSQWPQEGYEWFLRRRLSGWPTLIQIENARKYGCFVTPVGHPHSSECHL